MYDRIQFIAEQQLQQDIEDGMDVVHEFGEPLRDDELQDIFEEETFDSERRKLFVHIVRVITGQGGDHISIGELINQCTEPQTRQAICEAHAQQMEKNAEDIALRFYEEAIMEKQLA